MPEKPRRKPAKTARPQKNPLPFALLGLGGFLLIMLAAFLLTRPSATPPAATVPADTRSVPRVSLEEARQALERGEAIFLDVRSAESFRLKRITGAVNIPENELPNRLGELEKSAWIIPYCT